MEVTPRRSRPPTVTTEPRNRIRRPREFKLGAPHYICFIFMMLLWSGVNILTASRVELARDSKSYEKKFGSFPTKSGDEQVPKLPSTASNDCAAVHSFQDILRCIPAQSRRNLTGPCSERIETWQDVQTCLNGRLIPTHNKSMSVHLIGERNSGTKFLVQEMQKCFPFSEYGIKIERDLFHRNKHFFQNARKRTRFQQKHIVIAAFRDPVEWVGAMIEKPYHMSEHIHGFNKTTKKPIPLPWQDFVSRPWTMPNRSKQDFKFLEERKSSRGGLQLCRTGLDYHQVIPCRYDPETLPKGVSAREQQPVYELKRGGTYPDEPYSNILELRSAKIVNFLLEIPLVYDLGGYLAVRFDDVIRKGAREFLEQVANIVFGLSELPPNCQPQGPRPEMLGRRPIPDGLRKLINDHLILHTERLLGYR